MALGRAYAARLSFSTEQSISAVAAAVAVLQPFIKGRLTANGFIRHAPIMGYNFCLKVKLIQDKFTSSSMVFGAC